MWRSVLHSNRTEFRVNVCPTNIRVYQTNKCFWCKVTISTLKHCWKWARALKLIEHSIKNEFMELYSIVWKGKKQNQDCNNGDYSNIKQKIPIPFLGQKRQNINPDFPAIKDQHWYQIDRVGWGTKFYVDSKNTAWLLSLSYNNHKIWDFIDTCLIMLWVESVEIHKPWSNIIFGTNRVHWH